MLWDRVGTGTMQGGSGAVGSAAVLVALVVMVVGGYVGWHVRHAWGANADIKVYKTRMPIFRKSRNRSALRALLVVVVVLVILRVLMK
jgi:hypothetical protein